ncbi:TlpA disulfide reductase family protein [Devosia rhodophyticola]|uniref:TlpA disulfide reductase family protein n=1 Tax=Devosia rhodophyticola TaxID=3026423 RepID=A0ABY7YTB6_9HYPH|nr:TlpA disulfide reductase family protein [Devosia rhodophyticola]WDR04626.1 TlpA disulfide reductase family protein [Devosia rhodophyticola]
MSEQSPPPAKKSNTPRLIVTLGLASVALAISGWVYLSNGSATARECPVQAAQAAVIDSAAVGELAALNPTGEGRGYEKTAFKDASGKDMTIADFKGKALLVNFWASWCVPCREEMPALDALAAKYNSDNFMVLPINLDIGDEGPGKAKAFMDEQGLTNLPIYTDASFAAFKKLQTDAVAIGLPTTLVLDANGCELAVLQGPAEWNSPDGEAVIKTLIGLAGKGA